MNFQAPIKGIRRQKPHQRALTGRYSRFGQVAGGGWVDVTEIKGDRGGETRALERAGRIFGMPEALADYYQRSVRLQVKCAAKGVHQTKFSRRKGSRNQGNRRFGIFF